MPLRVKMIYLLVLVLAFTLIRMVYLTRTEAPDTNIVGIRGIVEEVKVQDTFAKKGTLFVKGAVYSDTVYDKAYVSMDDTTLVFHATDTKEEEPLSVVDIKKGEYIDVYFEGPVMESYPVQGKAKKIIINTIVSKDSEDEKP